MSALSSLPADERERIIAEIPAAEVIRLHFEWLAWARDDQVSPLCTAAGTPWHTWLLLGGRGSGKTRSGAEWVRAKALGYEDVAGEPARRLALIGLTIGQVRSVMVEGVSGLLTVHSPRERPHYDVARNEITWSNGAVAQMFAADDPDSLRGPQFDAAWCDEFAKWRRPAYSLFPIRYSLISPPHPAMTFHETRFPTDISRGAQGGPERRTDVVVLGSGFEERNSRWANSRRAWNAGYGVKSLDDLHAVIAFFEERRGRLYGFRWKDHADFKSCPPQSAVVATDQQIGVGTGAQSTFQLVKRYGAAFAPWDRDIAKPVAGSVLVAVDGVVQTPGTQFSVAAATGVVTFLPGHIPAAAAIITAGFEFDVPVRFDTDKLELDLRGFQHGAIPAIPIIEIRM